jgi:hypothetical protein
MNCYEIFVTQLVKNVFSYYVQLTEFHYVAKSVNTLVSAILFFHPLY